MHNTKPEKNESTINKKLKEPIYWVIFYLIWQTCILASGKVPVFVTEETLLAGDFVYVTKYDYGFSKYSILFGNVDWFNGRIFATKPKRGDLVLYRSPTHENAYCIGRVYGLPHDKIMNKNGNLFLNRELVQKEYVGQIRDNNLLYEKYLETLPNGVKYSILTSKQTKTTVNSEEYTIPDESYLLISDNRAVTCTGCDITPIPFENIIGKIRGVWFSRNTEVTLDHSGVSGVFENLYDWLKSIRTDRLFFKSIQ